MLQIVTVSGRASTGLRYSQSPGRRVPNRSNVTALAKAVLFDNKTGDNKIMCKNFK